jgi:hypothetical protein
MSAGYYQQVCEILEAEENAKLYAQQDIDLAAKAAEAAGAKVEFVDVAQPESVVCEGNCAPIFPPDPEYSTSVSPVFSQPPPSGDKQL